MGLLFPQLIRKKNVANVSGMFHMCTERFDYIRYDKIGTSGNARASSEDDRFFCVAPPKGKAAGDSV